MRANISEDAESKHDSQTDQVHDCFTATRYECDFASPHGENHEQNTINNQNYNKNLIIYKK